MVKTKLGCEKWRQTAKNSMHVKISQVAKIPCEYFFYIFSKTKFIYLFIFLNFFKYIYKIINNNKR